LKTELNSKSVPKIKKSATKIAKQQISGFEDDLIISLEFLMQKPKSWSAQVEVIKAIGITGTKKSVPYLMSLSENEGNVITPRCYIAAACYTWPSELTKEFLAVCKESPWDGLVEIATDSFIGKKTKYVLV
jgi:hypothetical protein